MNWLHDDGILKGELGEDYAFDLTPSEERGIVDRLESMGYLEA